MEGEEGKTLVIQICESLTRRREGGFEEGWNERWKQIQKVLDSQLKKI